MQVIAWPGKLLGLSRILAVAALAALFAGPVLGQGPTPETGVTIFPGGAYVSYNSIFTARKVVSSSVNSRSVTLRPTFSHEVPLTFAWGFRTDFQLTVVVPIVNNRFTSPGASGVGGTGLGDMLITVKYRFYRADSQRGTTQATFSVGPKLPTGRTRLRDGNGDRLPIGLQLGSGSTDLYLGGNFTYTGLFGIKKLVADESLTYIWRSEGSQNMRLGSTLESRFWLTYRPYQSEKVDKEVWIGPALTWQHSARDRQAGVSQPNSGGDIVYLGVTTFVSPVAGIHLWFGVDFPVVQATNLSPTDVKRRFSVGITKQFSFR